MIDIDAKDAVEVLEGHQARLEVRLRAMPSATVTVGVVSSNTGKVTVTPASLAFTTTNWNQFQEFTITPADDPDSSDETVTLTLSGTGLTTTTVTVNVTDDGGDGGGGDGGGGDGGGGGGGDGGEAVGPPSLPRDLTAMAGNQAVQLSWRRPADDGGAPIVRYEYRQQEGDGPFGAWQIIRADPPPTTHRVTGLTNGTSYTFQVRAVNSREASPPSESARATPEPEPVPALPLLGQLLLALGLTGAGARLLSRRPRVPPAA